MAWQQTRSFNINSAGTVKYACLKNTRLGYGIASKYPDALTAWKNTEQHKDRSFPAGVSCPVFFNWTDKTGIVEGKPGTNYGHIAVRLADGRIWSDGRYFSNIDTLMSQYISGGNPSYLGWGESVNAVRVINYVNDTIGGNEDMIKPGDEDILRIIATEVKGWDFNSTHNGSLDAREMAAWKGRDFRQLIREGWVEGSWYRDLKAKQAGLQGKVDSLTAELGTRPTKAQLDEALAKIQKETEKVAKAEAERDKAMEEAAEQSKKYEEEKAKKSEDTNLLDSLRDLISKLAIRLTKK